MDIHERGDVTALRALLAGIDGGYVGNRWWLAMQDGDWAGAIEALEAPGADPFSGSDGMTMCFSPAGAPLRSMTVIERPVRVSVSSRGLPIVAEQQMIWGWLP